MMNRFGRNTIKRFSLQDVGQSVLMLMFFLMGMNFDGKFFYWVFASFFVWMVTCRSRVRLDLSLIMLLILAANLIIFDPAATASGLSGLLRPIGYVLCYVLGRGLFDSYLGEWSQSAVRAYILKIFWVLTLGLMAHILLNFFLNLGSLSRNIVDVWTQGRLTATGHAGLSCLPVAFASSYFFIESEWKKKIIAGLMIVFIFINNLMLAGRTLIVYIVLCLLIGLVYFLFFSHAGYKNKRNLLIIFFGIVFLLVLIYQLDLFQIQTMILESNLYYRLTGEYSQSFLDNARVELKFFYLQNMGEHLWGGSHIRNTYGIYAHDLYLDTYDYVGVFAFISISIYSSFTIARLLRCTFGRQRDWQLCLIVLNVYLIAHLEFFIEPIMLGLHWFFALFCLIDGMINSYIEIRHKLL